MIKTSETIYKVIVDKNPQNFLKMDIGLNKGDLITYTESGSPVRMPVANTADKVLISDPSSETGMKWGTVSGSGGGGGGNATNTVSLRNNTGSTILAGTIVTFDNNGTNRTIRKANTNDKILFVVSDDVITGNDVECYYIVNTICNVLCDITEISIGDLLSIGDNAGYCEASSKDTVAIAITSKPAGSVGVVQALLRCYHPSGKNFTASTSDLIDGESPLETDNFWYYYEE